MTKHGVVIEFVVESVEQWSITYGRNVTEPSVFCVRRPYFNNLAVNDSWRKLLLPLNMHVFNIY